MANTTVEAQLPPGLTLTLELYPDGSDTIANGAGDTLTEATNRHGLYTATVTEALSGYYFAVIVDGSDVLIATGWVKLADDTSTYKMGDRTVAIEGTANQLDDLNDISAADVNAQCDTAISDAALATAAALATVDSNVDSILADTNELQTDWSDGGRLDLLLDALITEIDTATAEPGQGAPAATLKRGAKLDYLYKWARNKVEQTSTERKHYADDGTTVDQKSTVSDDGSTFTRGEMATGA